MFAPSTFNKPPLLYSKGSLLLKIMSRLHWQEVKHFSRLDSEHGHVFSFKYFAWRKSYYFFQLLLYNISCQKLLTYSNYPFPPTILHPSWIVLLVCSSSAATGGSSVASLTDLLSHSRQQEQAKFKLMLFTWG
jgi:hypothetical protein